jgi:hypothetical protein
MVIRTKLDVPCLGKCIREEHYFEGASPWIIYVTAGYDGSPEEAAGNGLDPRAFGPCERPAPQAYCTRVGSVR